MSKPFDRYGRVKAADVNYTGSEPDWENVLEWDEAKFKRERSRMLRFYNYYLCNADLKQDVEKWMADNGYTKDQIKHVKSFGNLGVTFTGSKLCRAMNRGMPEKHPAMTALDYDDIGFVEKEISTLLNKQSKKIEEQEEKKKTPTENINPMERLKRKVQTTVVRDLDWMLDEWINKDTKVKSISIHTSLKAHNTPLSGLKYVLEWLDRHKWEYESAYHKTESDYVEGYSYLSKPALTNRIKALDKIIADVEKYKATNTKARKPRVKKVKTAEKQVKDLKYLTEHDELAVTSISPMNIPGSNKLFLYNTKQRKLTVLTSDEGFFVAGTTVKQFKQEDSYTTTLRKPSETIHAIVTKTEKQTAKVLDALTTKKTTANGRINNDTLILKTY